MKRIEKLNKAYIEIENFRDKLGEEFDDAYHEDDNNTYETAKSIIHVFDMCETKRDVEFADKMLIAICGYGIDSLLNRIIEKDREQLVALWKQAQQIAKEKYEEETTEGAWEEADKYAREDYVFAAYMRLKGEK